MSQNPQEVLTAHNAAGLHGLSTRVTSLDSLQQMSANGEAGITAKVDLMQVHAHVCSNRYIGLGLGNLRNW